jgi:hypothetical protein
MKTAGMKRAGAFLGTLLALTFVAACSSDQAMKGGSGGETASVGGADSGTSVGTGDSGTACTAIADWMTTQVNEQTLDDNYPLGTVDEVVFCPDPEDQSVFEPLFE